jgi:hypothetical protein
VIYRGESHVYLEIWNVSDRVVEAVTVCLSNENENENVKALVYLPLPVH